MLFHSNDFLFLFLPLTFIIYFWLNKKRLKVAGKSFLIVASLTFYSWWNVYYLPLILVSILVNYTIAQSFGQQRRAIARKPLLITGICLNLAVLGFFKYFDFIIENTNAIVGTDFPLMHIVLPLAISFFTFQQISYLVDCYRGITKERDFINYALFVTFFPQLIAGPIVHHNEMMPQFASRWRCAVNYRNVLLGLFIFSIGIFKKVAFADTFAIWATNGFDVANHLNFFEAWMASLSFTFQLYFDFSAYTDMAIGIALLFNIKLPINFFSPYKALNIQDFWRRWHVTLSRFLRDYLYIPLGGNKGSSLRVCSNIVIVFLIGGLWHGASWMFVIWGALHGCGMVLHRFWQLTGLKLPLVVNWLITFLFVNFSWVFFRAEDMDAAIKVLRGMLGLEGVMLPQRLAGSLGFLASHNITFGSWVYNVKGSFFTVVLLAIALMICITCPNSMQIKPKRKWQRVVFAGLLFAGSMALLGRPSEFLYFNF